MRAVVIVALGFGCGRLGFGAGGDGGASDVADVPTRCANPTPWSTPQRMTAVNGNRNDRGPALSGDGLTLVFESDRGSGFDLWLATRASGEVAFANVVRLTATSSGFADTSPTLSADGLTLYFTADRVAVGSFRLYRATRDINTALFGSSSLVAAWSAVPMIGPTTVDTGELFYTDPASGTLQRAASIATATSTPIRDASRFSTLSADGLELYVATPNGASEDVFRATRATVGAPFGNFVRVDELSSPMFDGDPELSRDGTTMLLASTRETAEIHLYQSTRTCD